MIGFDQCVWRVGQSKGMRSRSGAFNILAMGRIRALQITITIKHAHLANKQYNHGFGYI